MEKIKAVRGSLQHPELVREWLKEKGGKGEVTGDYPELVYFVDNHGNIRTLNVYDYDFLFDIVTLEKPKLKVIKGNKERGNEVIELLESVGGINKYNYKGVYNSYYYIDYEDNIINVRPIESDCFFDNYELEVLTLPEEKPKLKVIRGDRKRGQEVIDYLKSLGGNNEFRFTGTAYSYYYIDKSNTICCATTESDFLKDYELEIIELPLPKEKPELKVVSGNEQYSDDVMATLKALGGTNKYNLRCTDKYQYYFVNPSGEIDGLPKDSPFFNTCKLCILEIDKPELKPFDKVLVRDRDYEKWRPKFFSHYDKESYYPYTTLDHEHYQQCIPYEGNEYKLQ